MILKQFETSDFKITVEQVSEFNFLATFWDKADCFEPDRKVEQFETFGGAVARAFDLLVEQADS